jgi:hypothetical protein
MCKHRTCRGGWPLLLFWLLLLLLLPHVEVLS